MNLFANSAKAFVTGLIVFCAAATAQAGLVITHIDPGYTAYPVSLPGSTGTLTDELVNGFTTAQQLGIRYTTPQISPGSEFTFNISGPGNGANLLPFFATATLDAYTSTGTLLFSVSGSDYGSNVSPTSQTQGGITLDESATGNGFTGAFTLDAINNSSNYVGLTLDISIPAAGEGQVTVTNSYNYLAVPEPVSGCEMVLGVVVFIAACRLRPHRSQPGK